MTSLSFKAIVDSFSRTKKGNITIQLTGTSYISLDKLSQISEADESIKVTLDSEQPQLDYYLADYSKRKEEEEKKEQERMVAEVKSIKERHKDDDAADVGDPITLKGEEAAEKLKDAAERLENGGEDE